MRAWFLHTSIVKHKALFVLFSSANHNSPNLISCLTVKMKGLSFLHPRPNSDGLQQHGAWCLSVFKNGGNNPSVHFQRRKVKPKVKWKCMIRVCHAGMREFYTVSSLSFFNMLVPHTMTQQSDLYAFFTSQARWYAFHWKSCAQSSMYTPRICCSIKDLICCLW